ncbi:DUF6339 family protein [Exiguobacterium aestuarii]|uniref:DUF6339 family protein n=1 Tax=Exiguobacterium aestuarii TaxID=273527 RepID=UPI001CD545F8|nr:DUF6339 family protein [Exiguobacterium aestuarii]MCA0979637.1 hypothetical protein [Exiguobacterium aestuarii]
MEIRLLERGYRNNANLYKDFLEDQINSKEEYFSNEVVTIINAPDFPIYMAQKNEYERNDHFFKAFKVLSEYYLKTDRDIHLDERFWHSLLLTKKREFILSTYPQVEESEKNFNNIVLKKFDWENYIYKSILAAQYVSDHTSDINKQSHYYRLIVENLDLYNYIIKYEIFRNGQFLLNVMDIINELDLSKILKAKIKNRDDLGRDERVGRRVIFEFNKSYPIVLSPMLEKDELKTLFLENLKLYADVDDKD